MDGRATRGTGPWLAVDGTEPAGQHGSPSRRRLVLAAAAAAVVAAGLAVSRSDGLAADLVGGALYTALLFVLAAVLVPLARSWVLGLTAFGLSAAVELLQLTDVPRTVVDQVPPLGYVLGSTFVATDLAAYAVGALAATAVDVTVRGRRPG